MVDRNAVAHYLRKKNIYIYNITIAASPSRKWRKEKDPLLWGREEGNKIKYHQTLVLLSSAVAVNCTYINIVSFELLLSEKIGPAEYSVW